jgi:hypothetical protein
MDEIELWDKEALGSPCGRRQEEEASHGNDKWWKRLIVQDEPGPSAVKWLDGV